MIKDVITCLQYVKLNNKSIMGVLGTLQSFQQNQVIQSSSNIHTHTSLLMDKEDEPTKFLSYNNKFYPIQGLNEKRRPAYVCHQKCNIRYTPKKMLYNTWLIRGMSIDEALKQMSFIQNKGAAIVKETLLEAQKLAVEEHNVEFKSNLWVAESFCTKAFVVKGLRRHAKQRTGEVRYTFCHYFVRLEEGQPPEDYYRVGSRSADSLLKKWKDQMRQRKVPHSL